MPSDLLFGSTIPFAEPPWYSRDNSPHYKASHRKLRAWVREYVDTEIRPHAAEWESQESVPVEPAQESYMGGLQLPAGIPPDEWDGFHTIIVVDELNRIGYTGVLWGLGGGNGIGCPPITHFGTEEQKVYYLPRVARGEIRFCLGITEPDAGSDVANIKTTAKLQGDHYVVDGSKKWITNGIWADYVTAAVRTGGPGRNGISMLIIPLRSQGVTTRRMQNSGVGASGSTFIEFNNVKVPVKNLLGLENKGFDIIMSSKSPLKRYFNPERLTLACAALRLSRLCCEDSLSYALTRTTFGKPLISNQLIRAKISKMGQLIEPAWAFLEQLVYTIHISQSQNRHINVGGMTALLKVTATRCLEKCCREAQQIMGGAGYNRAGKGARIEQISRDVRVFVVSGGSEEVMRDLAVAQEMKDMKAIAGVTGKPHL
ncbi:hypothetical protein B0A49_00932 [Cryomyces minteri]|uniref:Acyl-CoA dehydrogenase apdG n=1 Tax=Cryomyces minteri TaxID=331657 RepID=A0A4U0XKP3_9PEZI|nr:hypothetical protein B0A49_00932 [Cryomyces minteri]